MELWVSGLHCQFSTAIVCVGGEVCTWVGRCTCEGLRLRGFKEAGKKYIVDRVGNFVAIDLCKEFTVRVLWCLVGNQCCYSWSVQLKLGPYKSTPRLYNVPDLLSTTQAGGTRVWNIDPWYPSVHLIHVCIISSSHRALARFLLSFCALEAKQ